MELLKFSSGNRKLKALAKAKGMPSNHVLGFDLPAGWTCPMADICKSKADKVTGKITDGKNCLFRCYAANTESYAPASRRMRWHNFDLLKSLTTAKMRDLILASIPENAEIIRIHARGDFFNKKYFDAWLQVAEPRPDLIFFGYTKVLPYVSAEKPANFALVYSMGGKMDAGVTNEPVSVVVSSTEHAAELGLDTPCEVTEWGDFDYIMAHKSMALIIHGTQPAGGPKIEVGIKPEINPVFA